MRTQKRWPVKELWGGFIDAKPFDVDWGELGVGNFSYWEAEQLQCGECERVFYAVTNGGDYTCPHCGYESEEDYYPEGPMMNYAYPIDIKRVGDESEAALAIAGLPLCIVLFEGGMMEGEYALALTGGGMDLSWEIVEAYMRLGYLPPMHFCGLPHMAGMRDTPTNRWICSGIAATLNLMANRIKWAKRDFRNLRAYLKGGKQ